jgi:seryl-tRNA synthetase
MKIEKHSSKNIMIATAVLVLSIALVVSTVSYAMAVNSKDSQIHSLQTSSVQQQAEIDALKQQINDIQNSTSINLTTQIAEKDSQIANLTTQITAKDIQIANLTPQITEQDTQIENLTSQNEALIAQLNSLQAQLNKSLSTQEKIRDSVMDYIKFNHPETAQFMNNLTWTGGRVTPNLIGAETYVYNSNGWNLTIKYPVVLNPIYRISADYSAPFTAIPYRIIWNGTWQNWSINEISYVFAQ